MLTLSILMAIVLIGIIPLVYFKSNISLFELLASFFLAFTIGNELFNIFSLNMEVIKGKDKIGDWFCIVYFMLFVPVLLLWMLQLIYNRKTNTGKTVVLLIFILTVAFSDQVILHTKLLISSRWNYIFSFCHSFIAIIITLLFAFFFRHLIKNEKKVG
ncbi:hypothetical protein [Neobacillus vireti]|uniref:hypothetical protein n=1 Tax=Neobacillus vireti TaxID=220686 RepID=UPI0030005F75